MRPAVFESDDASWFETLRSVTEPILLPGSDGVAPQGVELRGVDVAWLETPLDAEFSLIRHRRADAGLGWLAPAEEALAAPLDVMNLGEFEPDVWIPASHPAVRRETISLGELVRMDVIHGPPAAGPRPTAPGWRCCGPWTRALSSPTRRSGGRCR